MNGAESVESGHDIYLEIGRKKVLAVSVQWPGWCRGGRDETAALQALLNVAPRYAEIVRPTGLAYIIPEGESSLRIVERVDGDSGTDYGVPSKTITIDTEPIDDSQLQRLELILGACWAAFDEAVTTAEGKELRKGPRGGGRDLEGIVDHVVGSALTYLSTLGWKVTVADDASVEQQLVQILSETPPGLRASMSGELPKNGPRGGRRWPASYFVRRLAWHIVDHVWEIEDRIVA